MTTIPHGPSPIALHPGPAAGFDTPFEMLDACHERVARMLALLDQLCAHLVQHGADDRARQAARDVMRYFDIAGPAHHEDEERHILPRLREKGHGALAVRLHDDHEAMAAAWRDIRIHLSCIVEGTWPAASNDAAQRLWPAFAALYRDHIRVEEDEAYPAARAGLDSDTEQAMGREMARRRGMPNTA
jgi:hemerythrin-like domain-containing protein